MLVAVRLSTAVVVKPATCAVDNSVTVSAFRLPDDSALSCVVVSAWVWVLFSAPNCSELLIAVLVRPLSRVPVMALACVVLKA